MKRGTFCFNISKNFRSDFMIYTMLETCKETGMTYQGLKFYGIII